jgi:cytosine/adenosine deaminase-related metal-dependent hydrolase
VGDISRSGWSAACLGGVPIRRVCFVELISGAPTPPGDADELIEALRASEGAVDELTTVGVSPHAFYSVSWGDLRRSAAIAGERDAPITMHVAETPEEIEWLTSGTGRVAEFLGRYGLPNASAAMRGGYMELLHRLSMTRLRPLLAHANYTSDEELRMLGESRCGVAYCPRSHAYFGHAGHRWREMLSAGVNVCVGTDSLASNRSLSVLEELRYLRGAARDLSGESLLAMGTIAGARALGLQGECGSLSVGKWADMIAIEISRKPGEKLLESLFGGASLVRDVWVAGRSIVREGIYDAENFAT